MKPDRPISDELLQRYFDGELTADERSDVESRLDAEAHLRLEALSELRGLLRAHAADEPAVDLSSVIDSIERAGGGAPRAAARQAPSRRWIPMSAMGGLLAAAAALVLFLRPGTPSVIPGHNHAEVESLEVEGGVATVFKIDDGAEDEATVIWADDSPSEPSSDNDEPSE